MLARNNYNLPYVHWGVYKMGQKNLIRTSTKEEKYPKKNFLFKWRIQGTFKQEFKTTALEQVSSCVRKKAKF